MGSSNKMLFCLIKKFVIYSNIEQENSLGKVILKTLSIQIVNKEKTEQSF